MNSFERTKLFFIAAIIAFIVIIVIITNIKYKQTYESFDFIMNPQLSDKDKIYIKTIDGKYWTILKCGTKGANLYNLCDTLIGLTDIPYINSQFTFHKHIDGTFSLETYDNKYLKRCARCVNVCDNVMCGDGINPNLQTHRFVLVKNPSTNITTNITTISIKTDNGRFLDLTECEQVCGKIITAIGLSQESRFIFEKIPQLPKKSPFSKKVIDDLNRYLPKPFPAQMPFTQN